MKRIKTKALILLIVAGSLCYLWWLRTPPIADLFRTAAEDVDDAAFQLLLEDTPPGNLPWIYLTPQERAAFTELLSSISVRRYGFWQESHPSRGRDFIRLWFSLKSGDTVFLDFYPGGRYITFRWGTKHFYVPDAARLYEAILDISASHS